MQYFCRLLFMFVAMFAGWSALAPTDALSIGRPELSVSPAAAGLNPRSAVAA